MVDWVGSLNGAAKAPGPSTPGMGSGNVPYAPGVMSGNLGQQTNTPPLARQVSGMSRTPQPQGPPAPAEPGPQPRPGGATPQTGTGSIIDPQIYMQMLDDFMNALMESTQSGRTIVDGLY